MKLSNLIALGLVGLTWSPAAWSKTPVTPPPASETPPAEPSAPQPPQDVTEEPSRPASGMLTTRAANAEMEGNPQEALALSERAIAADAQDPWGYYNKAAALSRLGHVDEAVKTFATAEAKFNLADVWARSVAIYGGAHAFAEAGRCDEARKEFLRYAAFVRERDPRSADMATDYAATCKSPATAPEK